MEKPRPQPSGRVLFYPGSGRDCLMPVLLFAPWVTEFWFVDLRYFHDRRGVFRPPPLLRGVSGFRATGVPQFRRPDGTDVAVGRPQEEATLDLGAVLTEEYECGRTPIRIHRRRDNSRRFFESSELPRLDVFFHRRDSLDGTNVMWLGSMREAVLDRLAPADRPEGGLLVTDGSCNDDDPNARYAELWRNPVDDHKLGWRAVTRAHSFEDDRRRFTPVGYAGAGYAATIVWHVEPLSSASPRPGTPQLVSPSPRRDGPEVIP